MNWEKHFRKMRARRLADDDRFDFGTVGGLRTVAELRDLVAAYDYSVSQTQQAINDNAPQLAQHPQEYVALLNDWNVFLARWKTVRTVAEQTINSWHPLPESVTPAETEYDLILKAVQLSYPELRTSSGDLVDIVSRVKKLSGKAIDFSKLPQPRAGTDADLGVLKASDNLIKAGTPSKSTLVKAGAIALAALVVLKKLHLV